MLRATLRNRALRVPLGVNFDITYRCNLFCEHCYFAASVDARENAARQAKFKKMELSDAQWHEVFTNFKARGTTSISLTGGEPTLRLPVIRDAAEVFGTIQVASNGIIPIPRDINTAIWVSVDGDRETHNKIRGAKIYDRVVANITGDRRVSISCTLSTTNYTQAPVVVENMIQTGVKGIFFMLYSGTKTSPLFLQGKKLARVVRDLRHLIHEYPDFVLISEPILRSYLTKDFVPHCCFLAKNAFIRSYFPDMRPKRCVMGDNVDCETCSCIVPVASYCLRQLDVETARKAMLILRQA